MELFLLVQSWFSLLECTQIFPIYGNIFNFTQIWMKLSQFAQISLRLLKLPKWFWSYPNLNKTLHRRSQWAAKGVMPHPKFSENIIILCFERHFSKQNGVIRLKSNILAPPNFWAGYATETLIIHPEISKRTKILMELFYIACLSTRPFEVVHIEWSCCKLAKFDLTDGLHPSVSSLSKCFCFHPSLIKAFLICPDLLEAAGPYPNAPILLKCF